jgi:epoxyqueuosine reductase
LAGLGWQAKNTMLINKRMGSWFFLAALLLDVPLQYDEPFFGSHCGTCTACLQACPTNAFVAPMVLDASRCISYLTIEHKSQIPVELRDSMGDWVFGCDVCQDVCPWNRKAAASDRTEFAPTSDRNPLRLTDLFFLDDSQFRQLFGKTPLWRPRRRGLVRNAAIALGNNPCPENLGALKRGLDDLEELIRGASAWALGRHEAKAAIPLLRARLAIETADEVRSEILVALQELGGRTCG